MLPPLSWTTGFNDHPNTKILTIPLLLLEHKSSVKDRSVSWSWSQSESGPVLYSHFRCRMSWSSPLPPTVYFQPVFPQNICSSTNFRRTICLLLLLSLRHICCCMQQRFLTHSIWRVCSFVLGRMPFGFCIYILGVLADDTFIQSGVAMSATVQRASAPWTL